jgi:hypothetical protein
MSSTYAGHPIDVEQTAKEIGCDATPLKHVLQQVSDDITIVKIHTYKHALAVVETEGEHGHNIAPETTWALVDFQGHFMPFTAKDPEYIEDLLSDLQLEDTLTPA